MERDLNKKDFESVVSASSSSNLKKSSFDEHRSARIWAVASGKGGVGKTFTSTSLAITLSKLGYEVIVCDLDIGGANAHTALGMPPSHVNIRHFLEGSKTLQECVVASSIPKVKFVQGFWDTWMPTNLSAGQMTIIMYEAKKLQADFVIVDLGAGSIEANLVAFDKADERILLTNAEPTCVEKTYRFLEAFICNNVRTEMSPPSFEKLIHHLRDYRHRVSGRPFNMLEFLNEFDPAAAKKFNRLNVKPIRLLVNAVRLQSGADIGYGVKSVTKKHFDLCLDYVGAISYDNAVWQAMSSREPVLLSQPFTPLAGQFVSICKQLIDPMELAALA